MATVTTGNQSIANRLAVSLASGFDTYKPLAPIIFNDREPTRKDEIFAISAQDGSFSAVAEDAAYPSVDITEVGSKTLTQAEYKKKLVISDMMQRFDTEGALMEEAMRIGFHGQLKMDQLCADVLNGGFATETTWDGDFLFSDSHAVGSTGLNTNDNLVSGALTDTTLNTAIVALRKMKDHNGVIMPVVPRYLVVPSALEKKARELVESTLDPESANNTVNTYRSRGIQVVVWELLTSDTAWFLLSEKMFHRLMRLVAIPMSVETRAGIYTESGSEEVRCKFAIKAGAPDYLGAVGSTGL